ncbi:hydroxymethylglutaryl-CoA synthase family protein [Streptomyces sp. JHA26]|uniref:hydroxymethylglutaryl-CoA synthase family protein n=1 Tax=Streptomyces sp. JHA26 TaxID=1917143 RepID=UPI00209AEE68|nr:hydroxymethylglutaryl-CoA synthase [Streptomyces sp. JHA26]
MNDRPIGIDAMNVYGGLARIAVRELFAGRGLDPDRFDNVGMAARSVALPFEDPVTHAVNAAAPLLAGLSAEDRDSIGFLITATESGLDYSKSVASYVHAHLGLSPACRLLEAKQACFAATAALRLAAGYVAAEPGAKALVIATDVALADARASYAEPATGTGAVALLVGEEPRVLALDPGATGAHSFEVQDTARPTPDRDIADVDRSLLAYLECLVGAYGDYRARVPEADVADTFDLLVFHTPFSGMVRAAHRRLIREFGPPDGPAAGLPDRRWIDEDFDRRVAPSLRYPDIVGNLFSGSLYLALAGAIDTLRPRGELRAGLFSYGSGCSSEFFSGVVRDTAAGTLAALDIAGRLERRADLTFAEYEELLPHSTSCLVPVADRDIDPYAWKELLDRVPGRDRLLALTSVKDHHRHYDWITEGTTAR